MSKVEKGMLTGRIWMSRPSAHNSSKHPTLSIDDCENMIATCKCKCQPQQQLSLEQNQKEAQWLSNRKTLQRRHPEVLQCLWVGSSSKPQRRWKLIIPYASEKTVQGPSGVVLRSSPRFWQLRLHRAPASWPPTASRYHWKYLPDSWPMSTPRSFVALPKPPSAQEQDFHLLEQLPLVWLLQCIFIIPVIAMCHHDRLPKWLRMFWHHQPVSYTMTFASRSR